MSGWVHTLGGLFLVTVLQMRPVVVLLLSVKVNNCVEWNGDNIKIMAWFLCFRYDFNFTSQEWQGNGIGAALQTKFGPCPPTPIYDR